MKNLISIAFLLLPFFLYGQEQITDIQTYAHQKEFIDIIDGNLGGENFTSYLDYNRLFIDFQDDAVEDFNIPYEFTCFSQNTVLDDRFYYILSSSSLVFDLEERKMHDHIAFSDGWFYRDGLIVEGEVIITLQNSNGEFSFGKYDPITKDKSMSSAHNQVFSHESSFYFLDHMADEVIIGKLNSEDWSEEILYQGEDLRYIGAGLFRDELGHIYSNVLDANAIQNCVPQIGLTNVDILSNKIYVRPDYNIIEAYDESLEVYHYYGGDSCSYLKLFSSENIAARFDFFNDNNFGFRNSGYYNKMRYKSQFSSELFLLVSSDNLNASDSWLMSGDTSYLFTRSFVDGIHHKQIYQYIPTPSFLDQDEKQLIKTFSDDVNIIRKELNESGDLLLTFNSENEGVRLITLDPSGNNIDSTHLFYAIYDDPYIQNARWSSYPGGYLRLDQIPNSTSYRIDRVDDGLVTSDTMAMRPYLSKEFEVSIVRQDDILILRIFDINNATMTEDEIAPIKLDFSSRIIKVDEEFWVVGRDINTNEKQLFKFHQDGTSLGNIAIDIKEILYYDDEGLLFKGTQDEFPSYILYYNGDEVIQLSDFATSTSHFFKVGNIDYLLLSFQEETKLFEYDAEQITLTEKESFVGRHKATNGSIHNQLNSNRAFSIFENVEYSNSITNILFHEDGYRINEFDLEELTYISIARSYPFNDGYIYSIQDKSINVFVDSFGTSTILPIDIDEDFIIQDMQEVGEDLYLFGYSYQDVYVLKCDDGFNDCQVLRNFDTEYCEHKNIQVIGRNEEQIYFGATGAEAIETVWILDTTDDDIYYYNNDPSTQIQFFERRDFLHNGFSYFTGARSDGKYELFRLDISEGPTATENPTAISTFDIFPNPTPSGERITSRIPLSDLSIYDVRGRNVVNGKFDNEGSFDLPNLNFGFYIVKVTDQNGKIYVNKLVVME